MKVSRITYIAKEKAADKGENIKLTYNLYNGYSLTNSGIFVGNSKDINGKFFDISPQVDADKLEVIAEDIEFEKQYIKVDGKEFYLPLTGDKVVATYTYQIITFEDWMPISPFIGPPLPKLFGITWPWYKKK